MIFYTLCNFGQYFFELIRDYYSRMCAVIQEEQTYLLIICSLRPMYPVYSLMASFEN